jgi:monovalent cation/hydrogen antiporter
MHNFVQYISLILIILGLMMVADKLRLAYPIVLVVGGLALSFVDGFSRIVIDPEMIFFVFLPPLLYEAAWKVSWKEFWRWRRLIMGFAFPIVIINAFVVACVSTWLIPGFTLALGFLLGGIVSPPDAVSAATIMRRVNVPKSLMSIAEGESLLNDASSLIVFRFAAMAVITGQFFLHEAITDFFLVVIMGVLIGLAVGLIFYAIHRWLPTTPGIDIVLTFVTPYCMYYAAEQFHFSGVLAVVSGGLFLSSKRQTVLSFESRIQAVNVWNSIVFVLNGLIFLLIGLELTHIVEQLGDTSLSEAIWYGLIISFVLIVTRLACTLGSSLFTRFMSNFITVADDNPGWRNPIIFGWSGMRGVVSLAMALSIPVLINDTQPFPYRNLILFITFVVILVTLVFQGLTLPWVIKLIKPDDRYATISEARQEVIIQKKIAHAALNYLETKQNENVPNEYVDNLRSKMKLDLDFYDQILDEEKSGEKAEAALRESQTAYLELLEEKRKILNKINHKMEFDEDLVRKYQALIDIEEYKIRERQLPEETVE